MPVMNKVQYDRKLTAGMVEDFLHDPILAAKVLLGMDIPPHQELRILLMWFHYFTLDDSGFSTGKSTTIAIVAALRGILMEDHIGCILSGGFRQGKLIFKNFDRWYARSNIFRFCVKHARGQPKIIHGNDAWEIQFKGGGCARTIPPDFSQDSARVQSERWNVGYFDEWVTYNMQSLTKTFFGRVSKKNSFDDCPIRQNHIHLFGTPQFKHHPAYKVVKMIDENIGRGNKDYKHFTSNWRHVPRTEEWRGFVDYKTIYTMQTTNPEGLIQSEVNGFWADDSLSYYSVAQIDEVRSPIGMSMARRTQPQQMFFGGFDTARGNARAGIRKKGWKTGGDDFCASILRKDEGSTAPPVHVTTVRKNNITAAYAGGLLHELNQQFACMSWIYDPGGGGLWIRDEIRKDTAMINGKLERVQPIIEMGDDSGTLGDMILIPFRRGCFQIEMTWGKMLSDSVLLNRAHQGLVNAIQSKDIVFAASWNKWDHTGSQWDIDAKRLWLNKIASSGGLSSVEIQLAEMDLAVSQLGQIDVERGPDRVPKVDSFSMWKFKSKSKKDAAYSILYAHVGYTMWNIMKEKSFQTGAGLGMGFSSGVV